MENNKYNPLFVEREHTDESNSRCILDALALGALAVGLKRYPKITCGLMTGVVVVSVMAVGRALAEELMAEESAEAENDWRYNILSGDY